jgi:hypothetical protein
VAVPTAVPVDVPVGVMVNVVSVGVELALETIVAVVETAGTAGLAGAPDACPAAPVLRSLLLAAGVTLNEPRRVDAITRSVVASLKLRRILCLRVWGRARGRYSWVTMKAKISDLEQADRSKPGRTAWGVRSVPAEEAE